MKALSKLQQSILEECVEQKGQCARKDIDRIAGSLASKAKHENIKNVVTQSIERLIDRGMVIGFGTKTQHKLFITKIRMTARGKRLIGEVQASRQQKIPMRRKKVKP